MPRRRGCSRLPKEHTVRIQYIEKNFQRTTLALIRKASEIAEEYAAQGYDLTLRQLYYQFVARDILPNSDKSYDRLGVAVSDARLAGLLDWDRIVDRTRSVAGGSTDWVSPSNIIEVSADQYQRDLWEASDQTFRPEVWVEKEALAGVIARAANGFQAPYFSCRGYVSQSAMWRAGQRFQEQLARGYTPVVIHLGDHDPSGLDMTRDIRERLQMFVGEPIEVQRIALNMDQIEEFQPPPNPAKLSDARAQGYVAEYGYESWELDALEPSVLERLIKEAVEPLVDQTAWDAADANDQVERDRMHEIADRWDAISARWEEIEELLG